MAFNGAGMFVRLYNWVTDRNGGVKIQAERVDAEMDGFAVGLSNCITKDGQTELTADIPFHNRKITGLGSPTADTDAATRGYVLGAKTYTAAQSITVDDASNNGVTTVLTLGHTTTGGPAAGIGVQQAFSLDLADGAATVALIRALSTDVTAGSGDVDLVFYRLVAGSLVEGLRLNTAGAKVTGAFETTTTLTVGTNATVSGTLAVTGAVAFSNSVTATGQTFTGGRFVASSTSTAVHGTGSGAVGVQGNSNTNHAVYGEVTSSAGGAGGYFVSPGTYGARIDGTSNTTTTVYAYATGSSFTNVVYYGQTARASSTGFSFLQLESNDGADTEFNLRGDGTGFCDGSWSGGGADYAEYFEWADGNPDNEDRRGLSVVLEGDKIRPATAQDKPAAILGVISANPTVVGDAAWNHWSGKYQRDAFGSYLKDDNGKRLLNPAYSPAILYVPREERPEWALVGLMGKLRLRKGQRTGTRWIRMRAVTDTVEEWLVR